MATSSEYIEFVCEKIKDFGAVRSRKMFGEYMVYLNDKPIFTVCDNTVYVKKLPQTENLMCTADCGYPYDGAKECYILDVENTDLLSSLIPVLEEATPLPKKKKAKKK